MKTRIILIGMLSIGLATDMMAQLPGLNKVKIPKGKKEEAATTNVEAKTETTAVTNASDPKDDEAKTQMAYYFNDKNGELSELYNLTLGRYDQNGYYCRKVANLNPQEVKLKIAECEKKWPDTYNQNFWVVSELKPRFDSYSTGMINDQKDNFEKYSKECDEFFTAGNYVKALVVVKYMDSLAISMMAFQPGNSSVVEMKAKVDEKKNSIISKLSIYHSSPFHSQNAGKVMFSNMEIVSGKENASAMKTEFSGTDDIFAAVYFEGRLKDYDNELLYVRVQLEGANYSISMEYPVTKENENLSSLMIPIVSSPSQTKLSGTYDVVKMLATEMKEGTNKITIYVLNNNQRLQLERGEIYKQQITFDGSAMERIKKLNDEFYKIKVAEARIPAAVITNTALESDAKKVSTGLFVGNVTPLRVTLQENWNLEYDDYGDPYFRYLRAFVAIKDNNTNKCYYQMMKIGQDYVGGGKYGATYLYDAAAPYDLNEIECSNVNK